ANIEEAQPEKSRQQAAYMRFPGDLVLIAGHDVYKAGDKIDDQPHRKERHGSGGPEDRPERQATTTESRTARGTVDAEGKARGSAHHAGDCTRCADQRRLAQGVNRPETESGRQAREGKKGQETQSPQPVGERRAESGEPDRVDRQMRKTAMQEGIGEGAGKSPHFKIELAGIANRDEGGADQKLHVLPDAEHIKA